MMEIKEWMKARSESYDRIYKHNPLRAQDKTFIMEIIRATWTEAIRQEQPQESKGCLCDDCKNMYCEGLFTQSNEDYSPKYKVVECKGFIAPKPEKGE